MQQHELDMHPVMQQVDHALIVRQPSMSKALALCQSLSGKDDKHFIGPKGIVKDSAQWSRIMNAGQHNFPHDKFGLFMDLAENEAPLMWLLHSRGYDLTSLRLRETEFERENRLLREENDRLKAERAIERRAFSEIFAGRVPEFA